MAHRGLKKGETIRERAARECPDITRFGLTVTSDGEKVWLDSPNNPISQH